MEIETGETLLATNSAMYLVMFSVLLLCCIILNEMVNKIGAMKNQSFILITIRSELLHLVLMYYLESFHHERL